MGAFSKLFGKIKAKKAMGQFFEMLDGYSPAFQTYDGGVYEMELTRACIHSFAAHCSKLKPKVEGADLRGLQGVLAIKPNAYHTTAQFLYKAATIYEAVNTVFILPVFDALGDVVGFYPTSPDQSELREYEGKAYLVHTFGDGQTAAVELERVGIVSKFLYHSDIIGEDNGALDPTLQLISTQNQGIAEGVKNSAALRFMATYANFAKDKDLAQSRADWVEKNLGPDGGGLALFPNTYTNVQQIKSQSQTVDPEQMKTIEHRVYTYFGTNERILTNAATGDDWSAYYEGKIAPFALQLAQAMTAMVYSAAELRRSNAITWSSSRLQYMTNTDKLQTSTQLFDRGVLSTNDVMDIWELPHVPDGDKRYIRREYVEVEKLGQEEPAPAPPAPDPDPEGGDQDGNT